MCMLLMGCGSGGGFNPLSLNPTLLALPENSFSRTGGQFAAASSQYLSVASNAELQTGDVDFWVSAWVWANSNSDYCIVGKDSTSSREYTLAVVPRFSQISFSFYINGGSGGLLVTSPTSYALNTWHHVFAWHEPTENKIFMLVNGTLFSASTTAAPNVGSADLTIGARDLTSSRIFLDGRLDNVLLGKPPTSLGDGTSGSLAHTIATALYNSGNGLAFQDITSAQETDWGIVSGWLDNSLTADAFGSNTLTNNNGVTQAAGKVNAVAVDNDPVYFVNDASTNNNDLVQVTLANRPFYKSAGYWQFDGTNDVLSNTSFSINTTKLTLSAIVQNNDTSLNKSLLALGGSGLVRLQYFSNVIYFQLASGCIRTVASTSNDYNIWTLRYDYSLPTDAERFKAYINGVPVASLSGTVPSSLVHTGIYVGSSLGTTLDGSIGEILLKTDYLTDTQLNSYGSYLVSKYPSLSLSWTDIT